MNISVIIPTYNRAHCLERAIDSVLLQSHQAHEIIIIDDGSTDHTQQLIADKYPALTLISQANQGVSAARNVGIHRAKNDWIAFLDSDDEWLEGKLYRQIELLKQQDLPLCHTEEIWVRNGKRVNAMKKHAKTGGFIYKNCLPLCAISPSASLIKKSLLLALGGFDETLPACEDYDLWLKICSQHAVAFVEEPQIIKYGGHQDQLSHFYPAMDKFRIRALMHMLDTQTLSDDNQSATLAMLHKKLTILTKGATKRGKMQDLEQYRAYSQQYPLP